ncbi:MAG: hypothetical protein WAN43_16075 [Rhodomicrobium sp.]
MPTFRSTIDAQAAYARLDAIGPKARQALKDALTPIAPAMQSDARDIALAHIHSIGDPAKAGRYLASIRGGLTDKGYKIVGWLRSGSPLGHLLELGFTIKDWVIVPGTGERTKSHLGALMAFDVGGVSKVVKTVHRHATKVQAYPAIGPAFTKHRAEILAALDSVKDKVSD